MNDIVFSEVSQEDFSEIYAIEKAAYPIPWSEKTMRSMFMGNEYKIKMTNYDKIIGYVFVMIVLDEATILNITVAPEHQGKGLGKCLLRYVKTELEQKKITSVFLEVRESNIAALSLYEAEGFHEIDVRKGYYPTVNGRENAIIMACMLMSW